MGGFLVHRRHCALIVLYDVDRSTEQLFWTRVVRMVNEASKYHFVGVLRTFDDAFLARLTDPSTEYSVHSIDIPSRPPSYHHHHHIPYGTRRRLPKATYSTEAGDRSIRNPTKK